jgi:hypothetical protein
MCPEHLSTQWPPTSTREPPISVGREWTTIMRLKKAAFVSALTAAAVMLAATAAYATATVSLGGTRHTPRPGGCHRYSHRHTLLRHQLRRDGQPHRWHHDRNASCRRLCNGRYADREHHQHELEPCVISLFPVDITKKKEYRHQLSRSVGHPIGPFSSRMSVVCTRRRTGAYERLASLPLTVISSNCAPQSSLPVSTDSAS